MGYELPIFGGGDPRDPGFSGGGYGGGGSGSGGGDPGSGYSGGGDPGTGSPTTSTLADVQLDEGGRLALAYGEHLAAGHLVYYKNSAGPPPSITAIYVLGEGPWDSAIKVWYAGEELSASPDNTTPGYHFHIGTLSTGNADPVQGIDGFVPDTMTYSGMAYIAVLYPEKYATEERPDKLRGRYKCLKIANYDDEGTETDAGSYSANPARVAADLILKQGRRDPDRIDWPSWVAWRDYCDATLTWDDGTTEHTIPRFECHAVFLEPVDLATALDAVCRTSCTNWQDDGEKIRFILPTDRTPIHSFTPTNIVEGSIRAYPKDPQTVPRHIRIKFRDLFDTYLTETSVEIKNDALIETYGDQITEVAMPNMNHSQAQRIGTYMLNAELSSFKVVELTAAGDSMPLLPGDYATVANQFRSVLNGTYIISKTTDKSPESTADERDFALMLADTSFYSDGAHFPIQRPVEVP